MTVPPMHPTRRDDEMPDPWDGTFDPWKTLDQYRESRADIVRAVVSLRGQGVSAATLAELMGVSHACVFKILRRAKAAP